MAPDLKVAHAVTRPAYRACRGENIREAIYTLWGDDSTETPLTAALGAVLLAAEYGFGEAPDEESICRKFEFLTGCDYEAYLKLGDFDIHTEVPDKKDIYANPSKCLFYQDLMVGVFDGQTEGVKYGSYYKEIGEKIAAAEVKGHAEGFWASEIRLNMAFYREFARVLSVKADLGLEITEAYANKDKDTLSRIAEKVIPELVKNVEICRRLREKLWSNEAKIFGWEILDMRFHALEGRMESAAERINDYINGKLDSLPELEEERLPWFHKNVGEHRLEGGSMSWVNVVSASAMAWGWLPR